MEVKLEKPDLDKLEKRNFAHISKMFYSIQRLADKEEVSKRMQYLEDQIQKIIDAKRVKATMKMALAAQALDADNQAKRKAQAGGSQDMTKYFQTTLSGQNSTDYLPWKKTHFKEQVKITQNVSLINP